MSAAPSARTQVSTSEVLDVGAEGEDPEVLDVGAEGEGVPGAGRPRLKLNSAQS